MSDMISVCMSIAAIIISIATLILEWRRNR